MSFLEDPRVLIFGLAALLLYSVVVRRRSARQSADYLKRGVEHMERAEDHMRRVEEKLDRLIDLQERR